MSAHASTNDYQVILQTRRIVVDRKPTEIAYIILGLKHWTSSKVILLDISVVITVYNQPLKTVETTIRSVVQQQNCDFEIIIADDCSSNDISSELKRLFDSLSFSNYTIVRHAQNMKTVLNIKTALDSACGEYMKVIGSGDLLYDANTLHDIVSFMRETKADVGFGKVIAFNKNDKGELNCKLFKAPTNPEDYFVGGMNCKQALKGQLDRADWIPGGSQFYKMSKAKELLAILSDDFGVKFCEDFSGTVALADSEVPFLDRCVLWYEFGDGISTSGQGRARLYADHENFYKGMSRMKPFGETFPFARAMFSLRKFITLKTPLYRFFQKRIAASYQNNGETIVPNDFLKSILERDEQ